jgi:hypothetical protein
MSSSLAQDTVFSCVVTALFLRPISKILGAVGDVRSEGQISLEKTKWLTLLGASLAVLSSTAMYINAGLFVVLHGPGKPFSANPYLHPFVFGTNLDSLLNDVGMLLACGVVNKVTCGTGVAHFCGNQKSVIAFVAALLVSAITVVYLPFMEISN